MTPYPDFYNRAPAAVAIEATNIGVESVLPTTEVPFSKAVILAFLLSLNASRLAKKTGIFSASNPKLTSDDPVEELLESHSSVGKL